LTNFNVQFLVHFSERNRNKKSILKYWLNLMIRKACVLLDLAEELEKQVGVKADLVSRKRTKDTYNQKIQSYLVYSLFLNFIR